MPECRLPDMYESSHVTAGHARGLTMYVCSLPADLRWPPAGVHVFMTPIRLPSRILEDCGEHQPEEDSSPASAHPSLSRHSMYSGRDRSTDRSMVAHYGKHIIRRRRMLICRRRWPSAYWSVGVSVAVGVRPRMPIF